jgi:thiamine pyrophosphate-dependent acetolactate synthase large subunit-like protein
MLFDPLQLLNPTTGAIANIASAQRDFLPMLVPRKKVPTREGQASKFQHCKVSKFHAWPAAMWSQAFAYEARNSCSFET